MNAAMLQSELQAVPGVASAEIDAAAEGPAGVRVHLAPEADAHTVGVEVQRVLAAHGMRSRFGASPPAAVAPPAEDPQAVDVADTPQPPPESEAPVGPDARPPAEESAAAASPIPEPEATPPQAPTVDSVAVEERRDGATVTVTLADGGSGSRSAAFSAGDAAVAGATLDASGHATTPVLAVEWLEADGADAVTVVVGTAAAARAGAAVVTGGRAYAIAVATVRALRS